MSYKNVFVLSNYDNSLFYPNNSIMFEYHEQDLTNSTVNTTLNQVFGVIPINSDAGDVSTAYTDGTISSGTVIVQGDATKFFLVGRYIPEEK